MKIINSFGANPQKIRIETTESMFIDNISHLDRVMRDFARFQIDFAIDDFGTGYSNLARIIEMPFKYIKIDKSLLMTSMAKQKGQNIMEALLNAFNRNGMKIVVEGVENVEQLEYLKTVRHDYIQGYLYSKPVEENIAIKLLRGN
jgi:EAL domain-containing protein (putative c-di-GMP-specific phosphodiesterase class I)